MLWHGLQAACEREQDYETAVALLVGRHAVAVGACDGQEGAGLSGYMTDSIIRKCVRMAIAQPINIV